MNRLDQVKKQTKMRKLRIRKVVEGTKERPRLSVHISNRHISAQIIDDSAQKTLVYVTTAGQKNSGKTLSEKAEWVGSEVGRKAKTAKVKKVAFDRGGRLYHGRVKALADAARKSGLEF